MQLWLLIFGFFPTCRKDKFFMKIHYLGTCSGTEPMAGMHHTSLVLETAGKLYWLDSGECAAHTAYTMGLPVMNTAAVFVSHPHIDHIGGLANLLSLFRKLENRYKMKLVSDNRLRVFFPGLEIFDAVKTVAFGTEAQSASRYAIDASEVCDGVLFEDGNIRVSAVHNKHLKESGEQGWHSFSYLIEAEGRRVVFSGDVASSDELDPLMANGCDYLIHETGHHSVCDVCNYAVSRGAKALRFTHHGRAIIEDRAAMEKIVSEAASSAPISIKICYDRMTEEI